ncbi:hypothetical protein BCR41DRAFT_359011 [Lobosporangium transversale]|uniref:Uncharacterized protein n=1 Tax=Lobosporangium transversale TaxID=64571 RepID=A0A1Y2GER7_9FUNG|nr:hypothetical protein BCR41DRAFT_359011 [Lobosporangium transversale]ORZ08780.1 hypothetical protein BCR41DRAFT_359011 [Lobosporangium transversale]|eukprot:XP_021878563.1 hypothetical protein BCR41DRAFT_359011 [Lobosporangium transversale]
MTEKAKPIIYLFAPFILYCIEYPSFPWTITCSCSCIFVYVVCLVNNRVETSADKIPYLMLHKELNTILRRGTLFPLFQSLSFAGVLSLLFLPMLYS